VFSTKLMRFSKSPCFINSFKAVRKALTSESIYNKYFDLTMVKEKRHPDLSRCLRDQTLYWRGDYNIERLIWDFFTQILLCFIHCLFVFNFNFLIYSK
jgi:hypothetical protein